MKVLFLGNLNNISYDVAKRLHEAKYDVKLIIDAPEDYLLDRPESFDPSLHGEYPSWMVKMELKDQFKALKFAWAPFFLKKYINIIEEYDILFLNGLWVSLGHLIPREKLVINIYAGYELELADPDHLNNLVQNFSSNRKVFLPKILIRDVYKRLCKNMRLGIRRANALNFYPTGISEKGDKIINEIKIKQKFDRLELRGFECLRFPYDVPNLEKEEFVILNITRFFFMNDRHDNKRNDIMIKGIGKFVRENQIKDKLRIIFFEKGQDVPDAKKLCEKEGIHHFVKWQPQVSLNDLIKYFKECDVAFDQLGDQWIGAGLFSMLTGRPLIANGRPEIFEKITGEKSPVCQATTVDEVAEWLNKLYQQRSLINEIGLLSRKYVFKHYDLVHTIDFYIDVIESHAIKSKKVSELSF